MHWLKNTTVPLANIKITDDIRARVKLPRIKELADSFDATGGQPGNVPWLTEGLEVVAGRDRLAAALLLKRETVDVRIGTWKDAKDAKRSELIENLRKRPDDRDALLAELVALEQKTAPEKPGKASGKPAKGRPTTSLGAARAKVAKAVGTTPEAVRAAQKRAAKAAAPKTPKGSNGLVVPVKALINTFGLKLPADLAERVAARIKAYDAADHRLRVAQTRLREGMDELARVPGGSPLTDEAANLFEAVHQLAVKTRAASPASLCFYCKADLVVPGLMKDCPACRGAGVVGDGADNGVSAKLKLGGDQVHVAINGQQVPAKDAQWMHASGKISQRPKKGKAKEDGAAAPRPERVAPLPDNPTATAEGNGVTEGAPRPSAVAVSAEPAAAPPTVAKKKKNGKRSLIVIDDSTGAEIELPPADEAPPARELTVEPDDQALFT